MRRLGVERTAREAELEEITDALLLTASDNFNALAAFELRQELGHDHVFRLANATPLLDLEPSYAEGRELFGAPLTFSEMTRRFDGGAAIVVRGSGDGADGEAGADAEGTLLFAISPTGQLRVATVRAAPTPSDGDTTIWLTDGEGSNGQGPPAAGPST